MEGLDICTINIQQYPTSVFKYCWNGLDKVLMPGVNFAVYRVSFEIYEKGGSNKFPTISNVCI